MAQRTTQHIKTEFSTLDWILEGMMTHSRLGIVEKSSTGFVSVYVCERMAERGKGRDAAMRDRGIG